MDLIIDDWYFESLLMHFSLEKMFYQTDVNEKQTCNTLTTALTCKQLFTAIVIENFMDSHLTTHI